jgi:cytochrome c
LIAPGLILPRMDPERGKLLFASKGCVACHQVNGVGGTYGAPLDSYSYGRVISPFDFFARMWLGAGPMIALQKKEVGGQITFTGQDLADIVAFLQDQAVQQTFSEDDIPNYIKALMEAAEQSPETGPDGEERPGRR